MNWRLRLLVMALLALLLLLQYVVWISFVEMRDLERLIAAQQQQLDGLLARNVALRAEVESLQKDDEAMEGRARRELGLIREGETYFQLLDPQHKEE